MGARRRMIDPKFWGDETIGKLDPQERLFYIGLFSLADDEGRMCGSPTYLRSQIYPYDDIPLDSVVTWIQHLKEVGLIHVYEDPSGNGNQYIDHPKWFKYQTINRPSSSLLPSCPKFRSHYRKTKPDHRTITDDSVNDSVNDSVLKEVKLSEVKLSKEKLREVKEKTINPFVDLFNSMCPNLSKITEIPKGRKDKIQTRLKEHPNLDWWRVVFEKANNIEFEDRKAQKKWRPNFNWLIKNDGNAVAVFEGTYDKPKTWRDKIDDNE